MPNIRILAKAVPQLFCSQAYSYTKCLCLKKGSNSTKIYRIGSKVNQLIYTLICTYMPNIRILTTAVLQIFCSQGCSYRKCPVSKKRGITQRKIYGICSKLVHLHFGLYLYAKYQNPSQSGSLDILFTRVFLYKMPVSEKGE